MSHPSELVWARHLGGELWPWQRWALRRHLAGCAACRALGESLEAERRRFEAAPERAADLRALVALANSAPRRLRPWRLAWIPVAAGSLAVLMLWPRPKTDFTAKGADVFEIHVQRGATEEPLGARCRAGDRLRAHYRSDRRYLLIAERDTHGAVQALFPFGGQASQPIESGSQLTPGSWELDDEPGQECFYAFFSDAPVELDAARRGLDAIPASLPGTRVSATCCDKAAP